MKYMLPAGTYEPIRKDVKWRAQLVHDFNEHRTASNFVLLFNMCWWLTHNLAYYADTAMVEAVADCELALQQFDKERHGTVSTGTLLKLAVRIATLGEMLLDVRADHYRMAADAAFEFDQRSRKNGTKENAGADSHKPSQAKRKLCRRVDAARCRRSTRRESCGSIADSRCDNQPSTGSTA